ncbi:MAG: alpha-amylase family protein [Limisphaerales bacterium]
MRPTNPPPTTTSHDRVRRRQRQGHAGWLTALCGSIVAVLTPQAWALDFPGPNPGPARAEVGHDRLSLGNQVIGCEWTTADGKLRPALVTDRLARRTTDLHAAELFRLVLDAGRTLASSELTIVGKPVVESLPVEPGASVLARRFPGRQLVVRLAAPDGNLAVEWRAILRNGANAVRQEIVFSARTDPLSASAMRLIELPAEGARVAGNAPGSPMVVGNLFFAWEHPDSKWEVADRGSNRSAVGTLAGRFVIKPGEPLMLSSAVGVVPEGQLRRGFLYYVERERAHPYRPFLHYNSWYDICWGDRKIRESECLQVIDAFGRQLVADRGIALASFVWDDGWDDPRTLWRPVRENFPNGFSGMLAAARRHHSALGFWLSPFGGYGQPAQARLAMGKAQGFETGPQGFSLAGPTYYARFRETCLTLIQESGANFFKFDGLARSVMETEAMLRLTRSLRERKPDLFISITTGTWPSPFWLWYGDSTWRGGNDMGWAGPGSKRERWITYRDAETYRNVVRAAPLYPLNSLMTQGFAQARYGSASENGNDPAEIRRELQSFFASGTCLQELYVTPEKMSAQNWNDLAECASWAHRNADVLVDTHWIGGDPGKGQIYGWASWSPRHGVLALRNPSARPATIRIDIGKAFELPTPVRYRLKSPWKAEEAAPTVKLKAGVPHLFPLEPFGVLVFEAVPE